MNVYYVCGSVLIALEIREGEILFFTIEKVKVQWGKEGVSAVEQLENLREEETERRLCRKAE